MRQTDKASEAGKSGSVKQAMGRRRKVEVSETEEVEGAATEAENGEEDGPPPADPDDPGPDFSEDFALDDDDEGLPEDIDPLRLAALQECAGLDPNDRDNGRRLVIHYGANLAYVQGMGWLVWQGKYWQRDDGELAARLMAQNLVDLIKLEKEFIDYTPAQERLLEAAKPKRKIPPEERSQADKELIMNADQAIKQRATKRAQRVKFAITSGNAGKTAAMLQQAASHRSLEAEKLDSDRMRFNVRNGTLVFWREPDPDAPAESNGMIGRFRFEPHQRGDMITKMADVDYDENAKCPFFEEFLTKLQPDRRMQIFLQVFHAYALLIGGNDEQKVVYHYGTGANGKSAFIEVLGRLAGTYRTVVAPETITGENQRAGHRIPFISEKHRLRPRSLPAPDRALEKLHDGRQNQRHAEIHEEHDGEDGRAVLGEIAQLLGAKRQILQRDQGNEGGVLEVLDGEIAECRHHLGDRLGQRDTPQHLARREVQRLGRFVLVVRHGLDGAAHHFRAIGADIERQCQHACDHGRHAQINADRLPRDR